MGYSRLWHSPAARLSALILAAFVAATVAAMSLSEPSKAAFPGTNARIAFEIVDEIQMSEGDPEKFTDIVSVNPNGTGEVDATNDGDSLQPNWSADGKRLAYIREFPGSEGSTFTVFIQNIAANGNPTGTPTEVADTAGPFGVAFSPDGKWVAYAKNATVNGGTFRNLFASRSDGTGSEVRITEGIFDDAFPNWSADGASIAFQRTIPTSFASASTDVEAESFEFGTDVYVVDVGGGLSLPNPTTPITQNFNSYDPNFSPNGNEIAYHSPGGSGDFSTAGLSRSEIFVIASDGSGTPRQITDSSDTDESTTNAAVNPAFSPDGEQITYAKYTSSGPIPLSTPSDSETDGDVSPRVFIPGSDVEAEVRRVASDAVEGAGTFVANSGISTFSFDDPLVAPDWQPAQRVAPPNPPNPPNPDTDPRPPEVRRCLNEIAAKATIAPKKRANLIRGTVGGDVIVAPNGANTISGGSGGDIILVRGGAATVKGGNGDDVIVVATPSVSTVYAGRGNDVVCVYVGASTVYGGPGNDGITVSGMGSSTVRGGSGNETIFLQRGSSTAHGESGNDKIFGNKDASSLDGGTGRDFIRAFSTTTVNVRDGRGGDEVDVRGEPRSVSKDPGDIVR